MVRTLRTLSPLVFASLVVTLATALLVVSAPRAVAVTWSGANCNGSHWAISSWARSDAQAYAARADDEGYEWNGGCYKLNDRDDTPNAADSGGEGADCSGFVFKTWALRNTLGAAGRHYWEHEHEVHGPYYTWHYYSPADTYPFKLLNSKTYNATAYMDAFVYRNGDAGHIGMIYSEGSAGTDLIVEAKSDALGTRIGWADYRSQSAYQPVRRQGWTADCYPNC
jgi:hypothetical protein